MFTEIDRFAITAIQLDQFVAGIQDEDVLTVAIHVFYHLAQGDKGLDVPSLAQGTDLSRNRVRSAINALVANGKIKRLAGNPNRFTLNGKKEGDATRSTNSAH